MVLIETLQTMLIAGVTVAVYGGYAYLMKRIGNPAEEPDPDKLIGTVLVGFGVGIAMSYMGMEITETTAVGVLVTIGAVEVGQKFFKPVFNWIREKLGLPQTVFTKPKPS